MIYEYRFGNNIISFDHETKDININDSAHNFDISLDEFKECAAFIGFILSKEEVKKHVIPTNGKHAIK